MDSLRPIGRRLPMGGVSSHKRVHYTICWAAIGRSIIGVEFDFGNFPVGRFLSGTRDFHPARWRNASNSLGVNRVEGLSNLAGLESIKPPIGQVSESLLFFGPSKPVASSDL